MRCLLIFGMLFLLLPFVQMSAHTAHAQAKEKNTYEYLELFGETLEHIKQSYVDEVSDKELIEAAINGMLGSLDPHSGYLNEESLRDLQDSTRGEFGGLGIEISLNEDGYVLVVSPIDDTPADRAGLQAGDLIISIDDKAVLGMTLSEAVELMRGKPGTDITLEILRGERDSFEVSLTRAVIKIESVRWETKPDRIGYIRISSFNDKTEAGLRKAVKTLKASADGAPRGYILDLRNNPGGLLNQAIEVSDSFLERGEIVSTLGRDRKPNARFQAKRGDIINGAPLLVLINSGSASASEIVAGALQDHRRALVAGSRSFGKGSVQTIIPLAHPDSALKLTTQRYYTPSGESIQATGIVPDIEIVPSKITPIELGRTRFEADLPQALESEKQAQEAEKAENAASDEDYVLSRAIEILKAVSLYREGPLSGRQ